MMVSARDTGIRLSFEKKLTILLTEGSLLLFIGKTAQLYFTTQHDFYQYMLQWQSWGFSGKFLYTQIKHGSSLLLKFSAPAERDSPETQEWSRIGHQLAERVQVWHPRVRERQNGYGPPPCGTSKSPLLQHIEACRTFGYDCTQKTHHS